VVDNEESNAFAAPGGRIVVFSGLLRHCPSADARAGVLAHEIVHVEQRHGLKHLLRSLGVFYFAGCFIGGGVEEFATAETIGELSSVFVLFKHSRDHEREADRIGVEKLQAAGRRATGLSEFFRAIASDRPGDSVPRRLAWISTHPMHSERIAEVERLARAHESAARPWVDPDEWRTIVARVAGRTKTK
jgi:predicted Zn-dependent protease